MKARQIFFKRIIELTIGIGRKILPVVFGLILLMAAKSGAWAQLCQDNDAVCPAGCSVETDSDCLLADWPTADPESNAIWLDGGSFRQVLTKGNQFWYCGNLGSCQWQQGKIFESDINESGQSLPASLDGNAVFPFGGGFGQTIVADKQWWFRPSVSGPWKTSGTIFQGETAVAACRPLPPSLDTLTVLPYPQSNSATLGETITKGNFFWFRPDINGQWQYCSNELAGVGQQPLGTHSAFWYRDGLAEILTQGERRWLYSDKIKGVMFSFDLSRPPVKQLSPHLFGSNLVWPFFQYDEAKKTVSDPEVAAGLSQLGQANFYRFPGGHWSEWYHWYWGIGPPADRPWTAIPPARLPLPNYFGTIEFLETVKSYGGKEAMMTVNYLTGTPKEAAKWVEFAAGQLPVDSSGWTVNDWRRFISLQLAQPVAPGATSIKVIDAGPLRPYYNFDPDQANCDSDSKDGYGSHNCQMNRYEWQKRSIKVGQEWMVVDRIDGNRLTVRRSQSQLNHSLSDSVGFWQYRVDEMPVGYFAWLRSQPGYDGQQGPYSVHYWEIGNEPFFAMLGSRCNHWLPCRSDKARVETYVNFYQQAAEKMKTVADVKIGLPLESQFEFTGGGGGGGWSSYVLSHIDNRWVNWVAPHFYQGFFEPKNNAENFALVANGPEAISNQLVKLRHSLQAAGKSVVIIPNEFALVYHSDPAYGWWKQLGPAAGRWRDGLWLASLLVRLMESDQVVGANYWHWLWPGMMGKTGAAAYPFDGNFENNDYSQTGSSFLIYKYFVNNVFTDLYNPLTVISSRISTQSIRNISAGLVQPVIGVATADATQQQVSFLLVNRLLEPTEVSVRLQSTVPADGWREVVLSGDYEDAVVKVAERDLKQGSAIKLEKGFLVYHRQLPGGAVVIVSHHRPTGDLNNDGKADGADIKILLVSWRQSGQADLNGDGVVNGIDFGKIGKLVK